MLGQPEKKDVDYLGWVLVGSVLLVVLAVGGAYKLLGVGEGKYKVGAADDDIRAFNSALALYYVDTDSGPFPTTLMQLLSDSTKGWAGPYMATISPDPWSNLYIYTGGSDNYTVMSIHESEYHKAETIRYILKDGVFSTLP